MTEIVKVFLFSLIIISHLWFLLWWIYHFLKEIRSTVKKWSSKFYIAVFLCCSEKDYQKEIKLEEYIEKLNPFLFKLDNIVSCKFCILYHALIDFEEKKSMYHRGYIPIED